MKMVTFLIASLIVLELGIPVSAEDKEQPQKVEEDFAPLGKRLLSALRTEQIDEALALWLSADRVDEMAKNVPPGIPHPSDKEISLAKAYFKKRDEQLRQLFPKILNVLKENNLNPSALEYASSEGTIKRFRQELVEDHATMVNVVFEAENGDKVRIRIDDGYRLNGTWYFTDKPLDLWLTRDGQESLLSTLD